MKKQWMCLGVGVLIGMSVSLTSNFVTAEVAKETAAPTTPIPTTTTVPITPDSAKATDSTKATPNSTKESTNSAKAPDSANVAPNSTKTSNDSVKAVPDSTKMPTDSANVAPDSAKTPTNSTNATNTTANTNTSANTSNSPNPENTITKAQAMATWPQLFLQSTPPGDPKAGLAKSEVCAACHGVDGNSTVPAWPKIAGQGDLYLVKSLIEYRKGDKGARFEPSMFAMVQNLSDQDIADLAAYFASQTMSPGAAKADLVALGEKIYRGGNLATGVPACAACHGAKGEGNDLARFPRLSGQQTDYTLDQLKKFKAKTRSDDPNGIMQDISQRMSEEEMKAVSSYVSGLH